MIEVGGGRGGVWRDREDLVPPVPVGLPREDLAERFGGGRIVEAFTAFTRWSRDGVGVLGFSAAVAAWVA
ncbi:hypothetical protein [Streptosporangium lutulentum]|uniref:Uncharacterized protein n=1 Tax=Streptosporangium lutulentum TaxID=1461250 RepID=A0ABT9QLI6_9ACTN|nr:hypothetical protein [Streptosporangium lutulentum]MDP9847618.1 hypothetical protein [Streptosporangium lutulentum]